MTGYFLITVTFDLLIGIAMYSASRHLVSLQVGNNLRHACFESGAKSLGASIGQNGIHGRQFSLCSRVNLRNKSVVPLKSFTTIPRVTANSQYLKHFSPTCNECRCYSKSIGKEAVAKEENVNSEDLLDTRQGESESSSVDTENEEMDMYDEEDRGAYLTEEQIQILSNGDPEIIKKIKYLQLEFSVMR